VIASPGTLEARRVREEQDQAFEESLAMDRAREESQRAEEIRAANEMAEEAARVRSEEQAAEEKRIKAQRDLDRLRASLPAEPPAEGSEMPVVVVRLPDGSRLQPRRFLPTNRVQELYDFVHLQMAEKLLADGKEPEIGTFHLASNMPVRTFKEKQLTLEEADLKGQTLLMVQFA